MAEIPAVVAIDGSRLELLFWIQLGDGDGSMRQGCEREFVFAPPRKWRFDFAWRDIGIAVEIEGGSWVQGRHTRGADFARDAEKYNEAAIRGWRVYRFTADMVEDGRAIATMRRALANVGSASVSG